MRNFTFISENVRLKYWNLISSVLNEQLYIETLLLSLIAICTESSVKLLPSDWCENQELAIKFINEAFDTSFQSRC